MSSKNLLVAAIAIAAAGMTGWLAHNWMQAQRSALEVREDREHRPAPDIVQVLVATEDLPVGAFLQPEALGWAPWPENALRDVYAVSGSAEPEDFAGAVVRTRILAGEPINTARLVQPGEQGFLSAVLRPGMRAVSVPVDAASGIAGFVFPGDRVDVLLTYRIDSQKDAASTGGMRQLSQTLLNAVRVLAVDQSVDNAEGEARPAQTVTLEVDKKQAEKLALGMELGMLSLSLRSLMARADGAEVGGTDAEFKNDEKASFTRDLDVMYMLNSNPAEASPSDGPRPIDVLHGVTAEQVVF